LAVGKRNEEGTVPKSADFDYVGNHQQTNLQNWKELERSFRLGDTDTNVSRGKCQFYYLAPFS
jgi:hypothetical protein